MKPPRNSTGWNGDSSVLLFFLLLDFITINNHCALIRSRWLQIMEGIESSCLSIHYTIGILPFYPFQYSQERATVWFGLVLDILFFWRCLPVPSASGRNPSSGLEGRVEACICESTGGCVQKVQTGTLWKKTGQGCWDWNGMPCQKQRLPFFTPVNSNSTDSYASIHLPGQGQQMSLQPGSFCLPA